ncbi:aspartate aminotransferase family protein [Halomarina halobia]|uniref:Aspartate aminotransferase family protein n=1 Tax=Halomarina halobia TaxID=3033386 RepID=A0ABD6ADG2_9EURY|nr:aspartate aminotransferase family protein [Halomarina sp. PSR21]
MAQREQVEVEESSVLAHFGHMGDTPITITDGDGAYVRDSAGNEYLDFTSQLYCVNAGHGNEAIVSAMNDQLDRVQYVSSAVHNDARTRLADRLADVAPNSLEDVFFSISGSEANEAALQIARQFQDASTVLTRWRSYHGGTYTTAGITGDAAIRLPVESHAQTTGNVKFLPPFQGADPAFDADSPEELAERAADHLEYVIRNQGPDSIAALVTEVVGGSSGAFTAPPGYFERVRDLCDEYEILLIVDEVITGFGRCGDWFGSQTEALEPDMLTFAKGVTSAYAPLAGVLMRPELGDALREDAMDIGQTFAGNPVACAAGVAAIDEYEDFIPNVRQLAPTLREKLEELERHPAVCDVRGRGFHWAVEFADPDTGEPVFDPRIEHGHNPVDDIVAVAREEGVLIGGGRPSIQVTLSPPFCVDERDIENAVAALDAGITEVFE